MDSYGQSDCVLEIDEMPAGRTLDLMVAEYFMDFGLLKWSTDILAAWQVVEKLCQDAWWISLKQMGYKMGWRCLLTRGIAISADADTASLAICRAALKAVDARKGVGK